MKESKVESPRTSFRLIGAGFSRKSKVPECRSDLSGRVSSSEERGTRGLVRQ